MTNNPINPHSSKEIYLQEAISPVIIDNHTNHNLAIKVERDTQGTYVEIYQGETNDQ